MPCREIFHRWSIWANQFTIHIQVDFFKITRKVQCFILPQMDPTDFSSSQALSRPMHHTHPGGYLFSFAKTIGCLTRRTRDLSTVWHGRLPRRLQVGSLGNFGALGVVSSWISKQATVFFSERNGRLVWLFSNHFLYVKTWKFHHLIESAKPLYFNGWPSDSRMILWFRRELFFPQPHSLKHTTPSKSSELSQWTLK